MDKHVASHLESVKHLLQRFGVERAYLFGSAAKGTMRHDSDVDFVISFPNNMHYTTYANNYFDLADALETLLSRKVDVLTENSIKNPYLRQSIDQHKLQLI